MNFHVFCDTFSWYGWKHEGATRIMQPTSNELSKRLNSLKSSLKENPPDFLLIEPVWLNWGKIQERARFARGLAFFYKNHGIPVVFWSKEDPPHFKKFLPWAQACDIALTTGEECIPEYHKAGLARSYPMLFAAQPKIHKPYLEKNREHKAFFAGAWRSSHAPRMEGYDIIIKPLLNRGLDIFSRDGKWPEIYASNIIGSYPYEELLKRYSSYLIGLNISSVKSSNTMFPRRIVELPLADILPISDKCQALTKHFPMIPQSSSPEETIEIYKHFLYNENDRASVIFELKKEILSKHTYAHRISFIKGLIK